MSGQRRSRHGGTVDGWRGLLSAGLHVRPSTPMLVAQCALLAALLTGCSLGSDPPATTHPMTFPTYLWPYNIVLAEPDWLAAHLHDTNLQVIDVSEEPQYQVGHVPGAVHVYWQDLVERNAATYGKLAGRPEREKAFGNLGIDDQTTVVVYDRTDNRAAARFAWALWYAGHPNVRLLNGGLTAWAAAGQQIERAPHSPTRNFYRDLPDESVLINRCDLSQRINAPQNRILDVRTDTEVTQTTGGTMTIGSIPNARRLPWTSFIDSPKTPTYRSPDDLRQMLKNVGATPEKTILLYGTFSSDAALPFFALKALGYVNVRLYDGGWAEWGASPSLTDPTPPCS